MRISDWSSDVCSSDLPGRRSVRRLLQPPLVSGASRPPMRMTPSPASVSDGKDAFHVTVFQNARCPAFAGCPRPSPWRMSDRRGKPQHGLCRSEEHTYELQTLMRISYAVFCLKTKTTT